MANYVKIGAKICSVLSKPAAIPVTRKAAAKSVQRLVGSHIDLIRQTTKLSAKRSTQIYSYLSRTAQENFGDLLSAGKRIGYIQVDKNGKILSQSLERFLTVFDRGSYDKMIYLEQNFKGLDKASFTKLLNTYKTPQKMAENKHNIQRWIKLKDELRAYSKTIAEEGKAQVDQAFKDIQEIFGVTPKARSKDAESVFDKLSRKVLKGSDISSIEAAKAEVGDLVGTRIILDDISEAGIQKVVDNICKGIESGKIKIKNIENYTKSSRPYFTPAQCDQIQQSAARKGYEMASMKHSKPSKSGYVTAQMDVVYSNGARGELQIRGELMHRYCEIEHIPYDIRQGKNIGKNIPELEQFYKPVEDAVTTLKRKGLDKIYDDYILSCYRYIRKYERGKIKGQFKLPQFPGSLHGYEILRFENLEKIHTRAKEIKTAAESLAIAA